MSWESVKLEDISSGIQTGPFGSQLHQSDYTEDGTPVVMPKDLIGGKISEQSIARVGAEHVQRLQRHIIQNGDILYSRRGDVGRCAFATERETGWLCGTGCLRVTVNPRVADKKFVFYQLQQSSTIDWVEKHAVGATMLNLNTKILSNIPVFLPPIETQHRIADILSAYDDLIENNRKQIKLLEEAAQRLYKEWFVDLRFPGHEHTKIVDGVPEGWEKRTVGSLIDKPIRTKQIPTADYQTDGMIPVIDQSREFISGYTNDTESLVQSNVPVIVFGDHTRILKLIQFPFAKGADGTQLICSSSNHMPQRLLYCSLLNIDLSNYHYARHFKYLKAEVIFVPTVEIANLFESIAEPLYTKVQRCREICYQAQQARDRLLPKLMTGEVEV